MNRYACVADNGVVLYTMSLESDSLTPANVPNCTFVAVAVDADDAALMASYYDFDAKAFVALPPKPSDNYDFDATTKQWVFNAQRAADAAVAQRNQLLYGCDWTQLPDAPVDKAAWATYRQALRDITEQPDYPETIDWPVPPAA